MKILLADDHLLFREGLKLLLEMQPDMEVVAEVADLRHLLETVKDTNPDLLIMDYHMPGGESSALLAHCKQRFEALKVIALTGSRSGAVLKQLQQADADAVLLKDTPPKTLLAAIDSIFQGKKILGDDVSEKINEMETELTQRELQILQLVYRGLSTAELASQLNISAKTADKHRENLMRKLQVSNVVQLIHRVKEMNLLPEEGLTSK